MAQLVEDAPVLGDAAVGDPEDATRRHREPPAGRRSAHELDLGGPADVEVVAEDTFEEGPPGGRPVEHQGVGDLELSDGQFVGVAGTQVGDNEQGGQPA